jgi:hypothetical protein
VADALLKIAQAHVPAPDKAGDADLSRRHLRDAMRKSLVMCPESASCVRVKPASRANALCWTKRYDTVFIINL